jgi:hypothetical protein
VKVVIPLGIIVIGVLVIIFAGFKYVDQKDFVKNSNKAIGTIIGYEYSDGSRQQLSQDSESGFAGRVDVSQASPIIEFSLPEGRLVTFVSTTSTNLAASEDVNVIYLIASPEKAQIDDFFSVWGWIYIIGGFGCVLCLVGFLLKLMI